MAINQNHLAEELNGVKCAIVEKNVAGERVDFLRRILEYNRYTVVVVPSPPPKAAPAGAPAIPAAPAAAIPAAAQGATAAGVPAAGTAAAGAPAGGVLAAGAPAGGPGPADTAAPPPAPETFTVGVTDVMFNPVNAVFGRLLKTPGGHIVTLAYWQQREIEPDNEKPYFDGK